MSEIQSVSSLGTEACPRGVPVGQSGAWMRWMAAGSSGQSRGGITCGRGRRPRVAGSISPGLSPGGDVWMLRLGRSGIRGGRPERNARCRSRCGGQLAWRFARTKGLRGAPLARRRPRAHRRRRLSRSLPGTAPCQQRILQARSTRLSAWHAPGLSRSAIAVQVGMTRSAVIGALWRRGDCPGETRAAAP